MILEHEHLPETSTCSFGQSSVQHLPSTNTQTVTHHHNTQQIFIEMLFVYMLLFFIIICQKAINSTLSARSFI